MFKKLPEKRIDIEKASMMSAVMNTVEAVVLVLLLVADFFGVFRTRPFLWQPLLVLAVSALLFEACLSIRDAFIWRDTHRQNEMLKDAWGQLQDLNNQLRHLPKEDVMKFTFRAGKKLQEQKKKKLRLQVVKIFKELTQREGVTIVMTTHDTGLMEIGDAVYELEDGEIVHASEG